jgi:hypothetical protein
LQGSARHPHGDFCKSFRDLQNFRKLVQRTRRLGDGVALQTPNNAVSTDVQVRRRNGIIFYLFALRQGRRENVFAKT